MNQYRKKVTPLAAVRSGHKFITTKLSAKEAEEMALEPGDWITKEPETTGKPRKRLFFLVAARDGLRIYYFKSPEVRNFAKI